MQRWDGGEYYYKFGNACQNFDFTLSSFLNGFSLIGHPTLAFAPLVAIGEFFNFRGVSGVMVVNLVFTIAMLICLYRLLKEKFSTMSSNIAALAVLVVSCVPLFLGSFGYFQPDYYLIIFLIFLISSEYKKYYILFVFWELALLQTKETGMIVLAGYIFFRLLAILINNKVRWRNKFKALWIDPFNRLTLISIGLFGLYSLANGGISQWGLADDLFSSSGSGGGINRFGIDPEYILERIKQLFIMDLAWVFWLVIAIFLILFFVHRRKNHNHPDLNIQLTGLIGTLIAYSALYVSL
jgi:hypothetical protein